MLPPSNFIQPISVKYFTFSIHLIRMIQAITASNNSKQLHNLQVARLSPPQICFNNNSSRLFIFILPLIYQEIPLRLNLFYSA